MTNLKLNFDYKDNYMPSLQESKRKLKGNIVIWKTRIICRICVVWKKRKYNKYKSE